MPMTPCENGQLKLMVRLETEAPFIAAFLRLSLIGQCLAWGGSLRNSADRRPEPERQRNATQQVLRWRGLSSLVVLFCSLHCYRASGQVVPSLRLGPRISVFNTYTDVKPNLQDYQGNRVFGFTAGGYLQTRHVIGLDLRGSVTRWGGREHQEAVLFGPRAALHFGRYSPYAAALGGAAHSWWFREPGSHDLAVYDQVSPDLTCLGGIDIYIAHHVVLRLGEASYSRVFRSDNTLSAFSIGSGFVYHLNR